MKTKSMIEHSRLHRPQQPILSRLEGMVLAAGVLAAYMLIAWLNSGATT